MWCLFLLGPHIFHSRQNLNSCATGSWLRTEIPRVWGLSCTLATARMLQLAKGLKRRARCQDQSVVWCSTLSLSSAQSGSAQSWGLHAEPPSSASKLGMWSLCEKHKKNKLFSQFCFCSQAGTQKLRPEGREYRRVFTPVIPGIGDSCQVLIFLERSYRLLRTAYFSPVAMDRLVNNCALQSQRADPWFLRH